MMPHLFLAFDIFMFALFALRSKYNAMSYILTHFPLIIKLLTIGLLSEIQFILPAGYNFMIMVNGCNNPMLIQRFK
jgi:hypothetical protein